MGTGSSFPIISGPRAIARHALSSMDHLENQFEDRFILRDAVEGTVKLFS